MMITFTFIRCSNLSALGFKFKTGLNITIHQITCCYSRRMIAKNDSFIHSAYLKMHMTLTSNINKNQKLCLTDLLKLFFACTSRRLLRHRWNQFLIVTSPESLNRLKTPSIISVLTLIKNNMQLHLKIWKNLFGWSKAYNSSVCKKIESKIFKKKKNFAIKIDTTGLEPTTT